MVDILDEAIEDIRQEKMQNLFFKYMKVLFAVAAFSFIASVSYYWWQRFQDDKIYELAGKFATAELRLQTPNYREGLDLFEQIATTNTSYGAMAGLNYASYLTLIGEKGKAIEIYQRVVDNNSMAEVFRDYAKLNIIAAKLNAEFIKPEEGITEYQKYIKSKPIFKHAAEEQLATIYLSIGQKTQARDTLSQLVTATSTPITLKKRAEELLALASE